MLLEFVFWFYFHPKELLFECWDIFMTQIKALTIGDSFQKYNYGFELKS